MRSLAVACYLFAFCTAIFILGAIPSFIMIMTEKQQLEHQSDALTLRISDEDKYVAESFEASVMRGVAISRTTDGLHSKHLDRILSFDRGGIILNGISLGIEDGTEQVELYGMARTRADLSAFIRAIGQDGAYVVEDVPASTFTQERDLMFTLILTRNKPEMQ